MRRSALGSTRNFIPDLLVWFLEQNNIETILDDTDENFSGKMKKFNLIGIPFQILIGKNPDKNKVEFKEVGNESKIISLKEALNFIKTKKIN